MMFYTHGLSEVIVSDNGTTFFKRRILGFYLSEQYTSHSNTTIPPVLYRHVERAVQTFKDAMERDSSDTLQARVARFLFHYETIPHTTTGITPAEMLMGRRLRTHMSCLLPDTASRVANRQESQRQYYDRNSKPSKELPEGQTVWHGIFLRTKPGGGRIKHGSGPMSYCIAMEDGRAIRRHVDHIKP